MGPNTALGALSVVIGGVAYGIYITQTLRKGGVQPHPFSWILWALVTGVAYLVQRAQGGGPGSWVTAFTAVVCLMIGILTLFKYKWLFSRFDWFSLGMGLAVLIFYVVQKEPTQSAVYATVTDVIGYAPTIRKGWLEPHSDSITSFTLNSAKFVPSLLALEAYSVATWLYPATLVIVNGGVALLLFVRRRQIAAITR